MLLVAKITKCLKSERNFVEAVMQTQKIKRFTTLGHTNLLKGRLVSVGVIILFIGDDFFTDFFKSRIILRNYAL